MMPIVFLPTKKKIYTVCRSPHIDKKSREQFNILQYKKKIIATSHNILAVCLLLHTIRISEFPGVQLHIVIQH